MNAGLSQLITACRLLFRKVEACIIPYHKISKDSQTVFKARLMAAVLSVGIVVGPGMFILRYMNEGLSLVTAITALNAIIAGLLLLRFVRFGDVTVVPDIFVVISSATIFIIIFNDGGLLSRAIVWLPSLAFLSSFFGHYIRSYMVFIMLLIGISFLYFCQSNGFIYSPVPEEELIGRAGALMASSFFVLVLTTAYERERKIASDALIASRQKAESVARYKSEFVANMSHEIRTPMNGVLGMLNLVARGELDKRQKKQVSLAISSAKSLLKIINDVLDFSKVDAGKLELDILEFDLPDLLANFSDTMAQRIQEKGIEFILDIHNIDCTMVRGDPDRLRQIFTNLIANAIKFTDKGEIVFRLSTEKTDDGRILMSVEVKDSGVGIEDEKLRLIFDSFTQADASTTRKFGGTGLGLAIVKRLCLLMGGNIQVSSEVGKGSCFCLNVYLGQSQKSKSISENVCLTGKNILVVDDNQSNGKAMCQQLSLWGGNCHYADSVVSARELMELNPTLQWGLMFIDDDMPGYNGESLVKELRGNKHFDVIKIILMTDQNDSRSAQYMDTIGVNYFFPKPANIESYIKSISTLGCECVGELDNVYENENINLGFVESEDALEDIIHTGEGWPENCRVLLAEDQPINKEVMSGIFEELRLPNDIAVDGYDVLERLKQRKYSLILMDCQMPNMDGYSATRKIRFGESGVNDRNIPIVALTANAMRGDRDKCVQAGMNDYLTKPIDEVTLEKKLRHWILGERPKQSITTNDDSQEAKTVVDSIWDIEDALKRVRGKEERLKKLVNMFLNAMPERLACVRNEISQQNAEALASEIHTIKGIAGNLGIIALMNEAAAFEKIIKEGEWDKIEAHTSSFLKCCEAAENVLKEYIAGN